MKKFIHDVKMDLCKFKAKEKFSFGMYFSLLNPRAWPVFLIRVSNIFYRWKLGVVAKLFSLLNQILFGCDVGRGARIDGGLYLPHPCGVVIGEYVNVGKNCIIHQGVTLGARGEEHELANPTLGDFVELGTGVKILGKIRVGDYARVGANAVVLKDIPDKGIAVGIPARVVSERKDV